MEEFLKQLESYRGDTIEQILRDMYNSDDISLKTEFNNPLAVTKLMVFAAWCRIEGLEESSALIETFVKNYSTNMVSNKRSGRTELFNAVSNIYHEAAERKRLLFKDKDGMK